MYVGLEIDLQGGKRPQMHSRGFINEYLDPNKAKCSLSSSLKKVHIFLKIVHIFLKDVCRLQN